MNLRQTRMPTPWDLGYDTRRAWVLEKEIEGGTR
jgi:hypothetical protein